MDKRVEVQLSPIVCVRRLFAGPIRIGEITELQHLRAVFLWSEKAERQTRHLARLDREERLARHMGVGRKSLISIFGGVLRQQAPVIDDANLLDLQRKVTETDRRRIRDAFPPAFSLETAQVPL